MHIVKAHDLMSNSNMVNVMKSLKKHEIIVLIAIFIKNANVEKVNLDDLYDECEYAISFFK